MQLYIIPACCYRTPLCVRYSGSHSVGLGRSVHKTEGRGGWGGHHFAQNRPTRALPELFHRSSEPAWHHLAHSLAWPCSFRHVSHVVVPPLPVATPPPVCAAWLPLTSTAPRNLDFSHHTRHQTTKQRRSCVLDETFCANAKAVNESRKKILAIRASM